MNFIRVSSLRLMYLHPSVDPSLTPFFGEFPGLGLALIPDVVVPRRSRGAHEAEISFQISAWPGLNRGTCSLMAANITTRLRRAYAYTRIRRTPIV